MSAEALENMTMDFTTKNGTKVYGAVLNGNFKGMYSHFNDKYFGSALPDISVYSCTRIFSPDTRPNECTFGLTILPGDTAIKPDLGTAIFIAEPNAGQYGWQTLVHEMVHVQTKEMSHTSEFWAALRLIVDKHYLELMGIPENSEQVGL
jgi:hypothetical protein